MGIDLHKQIQRLKALDPHNVKLNEWQRLGINPMGYYRVTIEDGDTFDSIVNNFAKSYDLDPSFVRTHSNDIRFHFDYDFDGHRDVAAHFDYQLDAIELRQLLDRAIGECERAIKRQAARAAKGPTKKQLQEQERKKKVDAALAKLSPAEPQDFGNLPAERTTMNYHLVSTICYILIIMLFIPLTLLVLGLVIYPFIVVYTKMTTRYA
jgi:hypothetical protein